MGRLPAEYEEQRATVFLFPSRTDVWREGCKPIRELIVKMANAVAEYQMVVIGVLPDLRKVLEEEYILSKNIKILEVDYNDCWAKDTISNVVYGDGNKKSMVSFLFNAYGGELYFPWDADSALDEYISMYFDYELRPSTITLEGGNIVTDGRGTLFCVKESIVNDNRNPEMTTKAIEAELKRLIHAEQIVWISKGLVGDETGGHIDNVMAFCDENTILLSWTDDESNPQYIRVREIEAELSKVRDVDGNPYTIRKIPVPSFYYRCIDDTNGIVKTEGVFSREEGVAVLETYVNFLLANGVVLVPQFGYGELDKEAVQIIREAFPNRKIIPIYAREATLGGGGFHCLSQRIN